MNKKKKLILSLFSLILLLFVFILYGYQYKKLVYVEKNNQIKTGTSISMMLETKRGSGDYVLSNSSEWPKEGYLFNSELSKCENGGTLLWNDETKSVVLNTRVSDKCYVYFDVQPPDVTITATNTPITYGKLGSLNCSNSTVIYNQQYNRVEIS